MSIRVLVVDDSIIFRTKLQLSLSQDKEIEVVGSAINAKDAMGKIEELNPDVVTLDVEMPGMNGIEFLKTLIPKKPIPVVVVSSLPINALDALDAYNKKLVKKIQVKGFEVKNLKGASSAYTVLCLVLWVAE